MIKIKTKKSVQKRFKKNKNGIIKHRAANRSHINTKMTSKRRKNLKKMRILSKPCVKKIKKLIPYK